MYVQKREWIRENKTGRRAEMKKRQSGKFCCLFICVLLFLFGCASGQPEAGWENPGIRVTFFDVGKGDAILVETGEHNLLIDAGYDDTYKVLQDYFTERKITKLDYLVVTHFDKDHVGGADRIIESLEVGEILQPDYESDAGQYLEYRTALEEKGLQPALVTESVQFALDGAEFYVYPPEKESYEEEDNDFSLVISMTYEESRFLFAGDCEEERLNELLGQTEFDLSHDVLKVPHHGRKEDNSGEFLRAVAPKLAVITCSEEKPASDQVLGILGELGTKVYLTKEGTVTCLCDGSTLQMLQGNSPGRNH